MADREGSRVARRDERVLDRRRGERAARREGLRGVACKIIAGLADKIQMLLARFLIRISGLVRGWFRTLGNDWNVIIVAFRDIVARRRVNPEVRAI
jgi:hypothetical protein